MIDLDRIDDVLVIGGIDSHEHLALLAGQELDVDGAARGARGDRLLLEVGKRPPYGRGADVIGMAGGYTNIADPAKIVVKRRAEGKETVYKLNAREMAKGGTSNAFHIHDGDVVSVGESWF